MGITVEFKDYEEMITFAKVLLAGQSSLPVKTEEKKISEKVLPSESKTGMTNAPAGVQMEEDQVNEEQPPQEETAPTYTLEEVRAKLTALTRAGKQKEVRDILDHFKAKNVTALDPKDYAGVMEKAGAI
jgi:hypothetical protein